MKEILKNTKRQENIDLLKVRDYYFDKARSIERIKKCLSFLPIIVLVVSYVKYIPFFTFIDAYRDLIVGIITVAATLLYLYLDKCQGRQLEISNTFREYYDVRVFPLTENKLLYNTDIISDYSDKADRECNKDKYKTWYGEIFSDSNPENIICCQLDNVIYTYYAYNDYKRYLYIYPAAITLMLAFSLYLMGLELFFLEFFALFPLMQIFIENFSTVKSLIDTNKELTQRVIESSEEIKADLKKNPELLLREIQDIIFYNRNNALFIPKFIRNKYLVEGNAYYVKLNEVKAIYLDESTTSFPSSAEETEALTVDEKDTVKLSEIHERLTKMLKAVAEVFESEGIRYTLDGGTLIGAMRETQDNGKNGGFIFWDDDVDLAVRYEDIEKAKSAIKNALCELYDIQDYGNDEFYSPCLSNFRIREKNTASVTNENDSIFYKEYKYRGLFIDVYAYSPILINKTADALYRRAFIHPLNKRIKKIENRYETAEDKERYKRDFLAVKDKYLKRVEYYLQHINNNNYFAYVPNYIDNLKKAGPYIKSGDLYGEKREAVFENMLLPVPSNPDSVLEAYYNNWRVSPFKSKELLYKEYGKNWFSHKKFSPTVLKHLDRITLIKK